MKCAATMRYFAEHGEVDAAVQRICLRRDRAAGCVMSPSAPIFAVMPWNFPLWQVVRMAVPTIDRGQRRCLQARAERARQRASISRTCSSRGLCSGRLDDSLRRRRTGARHHRRSANRGGHPDRVGARWAIGGRRSGKEPQEVRPGVGRLGPVRDGLVGRHGAHGRHGCGGANPEQRPSLHCGQALHRGARASR